MNAILIRIRGTVQGVGFRPFVYRLAHDCAIKGWIQNTSEGVILEAEALVPQLEIFIRRLKTELPPHCVLEQFIQQEIPIKGFKSFEILPSDSKGEQTAFVLPDIATCPQCLKEVFDPKDRRYLYPFTNCTHCGPRYSIIEALPYDRANTSMKNFIMCPICQNEYDDPLNRRFHAQPNACFVCGPSVELWDHQGREIALREKALEKTAELLKQGHIVAVKGLGGFHLMADAANEESVGLLRQRKNRPHKPLAVMFPSIEAIEEFCDITAVERNLLVSPQAPIVLVLKKGGMVGLSSLISPGNLYVGAMLGCMPLQHILLKLFGKALVATSANISDEPICIDNQEALLRLEGIADYFLVHNRPIVRQVDDSLIQEIIGKASFLRRSRGFAPLPVKLDHSSIGILAVGAHQKNTVALSLDQGAVISQHIGDLDSQESVEVFERTIESLRQIYSSAISEVVCDKHPDYTSSRYAKELGVAIVHVQHHHAHAASCMAEHGIEGPVLGICFDGTGYGEDKTIWGGEFLQCEGGDFIRLGHLKLFPLPGSEAAVQEPRRSALGLLYEVSNGKLEDFEDLDCIKSFSIQELRIIKQMLDQRINTPLTSSMGRLFDGISSLMGLCHQSSFEGQGAMALEFQARTISVNNGYPYGILDSSSLKKAFSMDWTGIVRGIIEDLRVGIAKAEIAAKFHFTIVEMIVDVALRVGENKVVLTGGCFQNKILTEMAVEGLKKEGFMPYWHTQVPPNDGGIALGQLMVASRRKMIGV